VLYAVKTHTGLVRQTNQDVCAGFIDFEPLQLVVVADGMGGASAGEVASRVAVDTAAEYVRNGLANESTDPVDLLREAVVEANQRVWELSQAHPEYHGMGTTFVAALFDESRVIFAHVGDSRAYLLKADSLRQVTDDHSLVAELVRRGQITPEEAVHHPQKNIVTKSLGTANVSLPDINIADWSLGDMILLCSDGLSNLVGEEELRQHLGGLVQAQTNEDVERVADALIERALAGGAPDNVSVVIVVNREEGGQ
jgi:serine/threonine protein phosphatase PrpC